MLATDKRTGTMTRQRKLLNGAVLLVCGLALAACGVKSSPQAPKGSTFPRDYPVAGPTAPVLKNQQKRPQPATAPASGIYQYPNPPSYQPPKQ